VLQDGDSDMEWGEETLNWEEDDGAHEEVPEGPKGEFGHPLPPFVGPQPGPHYGDYKDMEPKKPGQVFALFWRREIFEKMRKATNNFGRLYVKRFTKEITFEEFEAFLGIVIHLGLIKHEGDRWRLWQKTWKGNEFVRTVMGYKRFEMILRAWHYADYEKYTADEIKENKKKDPFWPVAELEKDLNTVYQENMKPDQFLDIDEQCIPWKGRHKCRCYNKSKPIKRHFKVFSLNDSRSGYQMAFYLYRGIAEDRPAHISATSFPAERLLQDPMYHQKNHIMCADNWFASFQFLSICMRFGMHFVGTVQQKRKGIPFSFKTAHGQRQHRERGDFTSVKSTYYVSEELSDDVYYTAWLDRKPVGLLHTIPTKMGICTRMVKTKNDGWQRQQYTRPTIVKVYNWGMGGTDSGDQRMEAYRPELKTISWVPRVLSHFLNAAIVNSFIYYNLAFPGAQMTHYEFREGLVDCLVNDILADKVEETGKLTARSLNKKQWSKEKSRRIGKHWTIQDKKPDDQRVEGQNTSDPGKERTRNWFRGHCMMCGRIIPTKCQQCKVYLCTDLREETDSTCMISFHQLENFDSTNSTRAEDEN